MVSMLRLLRASFHRVHRITLNHKTSTEGDDLQLLGQSTDPDSVGIKTQQFHGHKRHPSFIIDGSDTELAIFTQYQKRRRQAMGVLFWQANAQGHAGASDTPQVRIINACLDSETTRSAFCETRHKYQGTG